MTMLPKREKAGETTTTTIRIPEKWLGEVDAIAEEQNYSRNQVIVHFVRWALDQYKEEKKTKK